MVLAVPAGQASDLLARHAATAAALFGDIEYSSVAVVTLALPAGAIRSPLVGTGFLVPRTSTLAGGRPLITGCTYLTRKWPALARADDELVRLSVGRHGDRRADAMDDDDLTEACVAELSAALDVVGAPRASLVTRWDGAFPQYRVDHLDRTATIERDVSGLPSLAVAGAALRGVGIPAVIGSGRVAARTVLGSLEESATVRSPR
jgi:oxygen-dependent protoporphyrinogen oxidase